MMEKFIECLINENVRQEATIENFEPLKSNTNKQSTRPPHTYVHTQTLTILAYALWQWTMLSEFSFAEVKWLW